MRRILISISFILFMFFNIYAQKVVIIEANYDGWTDTGIDVNTDQEIVLLGYGLATTSSAQKDNPHYWGGPAGTACKATSLPLPEWNFLATGLPQMALVGKIGSDEPFFVGDMANITVQTSGRLYLGFNDQHGSYDTNMGQFVCFVITQSGGLTKITDNPDKIEKDFTLEQNYPNPFNPSTKIDYSLNKNGKTLLKIYNSLGQEIKTLVNSIQSPGSYSISWDGKDNNGNQVPTGTYFYRITQDNISITKKSILIK